MIRQSPNACPFVLLEKDLKNRKCVLVKRSDCVEYWCYNEAKNDTGFVTSAGQKIYKSDGIRLKCIIVCNDEYAKKYRSTDGKNTITYQVHGIRFDGQDINYYLSKTDRHADNVWVEELKNECNSAITK